MVTRAVRGPTPWRENALLFHFTFVISSGDFFFPRQKWWLHLYESVVPHAFTFFERKGLKENILNAHKINILLLPRKRRILRGAGYWMWPMQEAICDGMQFEWEKYWAVTTRVNFIYGGEREKKTSPSCFCSVCSDLLRRRRAETSKVETLQRTASSDEELPGAGQL